MRKVAIADAAPLQCNENLSTKETKVANVPFTQKVARSTIITIRGRHPQDIRK